MQKKIYLISFLIALMFFACGFTTNYSQQLLNLKNIPTYSYKIINTYPHSENNFTQGFVLHRGLLYESSGLYGQSSIQIRRFHSMKLLKEYKLPKQYFAEGITILNNKLYQLTYKSRTGFVYDAQTLKLEKTFHYKTEGWGLTNDGKNLIMSDGSATLTFINPKTFQVIKNLTVHVGNKKITRINELETIHGKIYANIWGKDVIAIILPKDGALLGLINLKGINPNPAKLKGDFVLNGIAYNKAQNTLLVTGKCWPSIFEIKIE